MKRFLLFYSLLHLATVQLHASKPGPSELAAKSVEAMTKDELDSELMRVSSRAEFDRERLGQVAQRLMQLNQADIDRSPLRTNGWDDALLQTEGAARSYLPYMEDPINWDDPIHKAAEADDSEESDDERTYYAREIKTMYTKLERNPTSIKNPSAGDCQTPFMLAMKRNRTKAQNERIFSYLPHVENVGQYVNKTDSNNATAFYYAVENPHRRSLDAMKKLRELGADVTIAGL